MKIMYVNGLEIEKHKIIKFISQMDKQFPTPISKKTDILAFVEKLLQYGHICCALYKNEIIGIIGGYVNNTDTKKAVITILVVNPEYRGNKISVSLVDEFLLYSKKNSMRLVEVFTHETNTEAIGLYEKMGFVTEGLNENNDFHYVKRLKNTINVLVTAIGSFSADIVIKQLKQMNYRIVGCDIYPKEWIVDAYNVSQFYQVPFASKEMEYLEFIQRVCIKEKINYIVPLTDTEVDVFNYNRGWFEENHINVCISSKSTLDICRNKKKIEEFISNHLSIQTIPTVLLSEVDKLPWNYPIVCKPYDGRSSQGLKYIYNQQEWNKFIENQVDKKYLIQPYIAGSIITVDIVRAKDNVVTIPRKELLRTLNGAGTSVYVFTDKVLEHQCVELANALDIIGCVNFEFIQDEENRYHFIECNPRFSGGVEFSCIAGYDCVINHIRSFKGEEIDDFKLLHNKYIARKYKEYVTCTE
mgnify:CR=1 FL=1